MKQKKNPEEIVPEVIPAKTGPVSKYHPSMCDTIVDVASKGGHVSAMIVALGIRSRDTFYRWLNEHPEFKAAYEYSKEVSQELHEKIQLEGALGRIPNFNSTTFAMIMNNKFEKDYKRGTSGANTEITINQLSIPNDQIEFRIAQKVEQLKLLGVNIDDLSKEK